RRPGSSGQKPAQGTFRETCPHQSVLRRLLRLAGSGLLLAQHPVRIIVVVEDPERAPRQLLITDEHRGRPIPPIPAIEPAQQRPLALDDPKVTELPDEHGITGPQAGNILQPWNLRAQRAEEVTEQHTARIGARYQANREAAITQRHREPIAL